jgi:hypothetical protein
MQQIAIQLPDELSDKQTDYARTMVAYLAAILVENSHFSDQVQAGDSLAPMYQNFLDTGMATLTGSIGGDLPGGPSAFAITTSTIDTFERTGRVFRDPYCAPWTSY